MHVTCRPYLLISLLAALFILPAFFIGPHGGDSLFHLVWSQEFSYEFWHGNLYPRWLSRMNSGCGGPDFFYYYPLPYYLTTLFSFTDNPAMPGWYPLLAACWVIFSLMGIFCYRWLSSLVNNKAACFYGALLYMFFPSTVSFYQAFTFTTIAPFIWLPLLLLHTQKIAARERNGIPACAVAFAGLFTTSINGALSISWVPYLYFLFCIRQNFSMVLFTRFSCAFLLGLGLAAFYLLPIPGLLSAIDVGTALKETGVQDYTVNFIFAPGAGISNHINTLSAIFILCVPVMALLAWKLDRLGGVECRFWLAVGSIAFFMMTVFSKPIWDHIPVLQTLQYGQRFGAGTFPIIFALFTAQMLAGRFPGRIPGAVPAMLTILALPGSFFGLLQPAHYYAIPPFSKEAMHDHWYQNAYYSAMFYHFRRIAHD